jgi:hypothetical protein
VSRGPISDMIAGMIADMIAGMITVTEQCRAGGWSRSRVTRVTEQWLSLSSTALVLESSVARVAGLEAE